jgi:hypothetical protein
MASAWVSFKQIKADVAIELVLDEDSLESLGD